MKPTARSANALPGFRVWIYNSTDLGLLYLINDAGDYATVVNILYNDVRCYVCHGFRILHNSPILPAECRLEYRQAFDGYCQWYYQTAEHHRQELKKIRGDINIFSG